MGRQLAGVVIWMEEKVLANITDREFLPERIHKTRYPGYVGEYYTYCVCN
ncbi:MAG: hypothetical protein ACM3YE_15105 [Bacteroidota bacterium]